VVSPVPWRVSTSDDCIGSGMCVALSPTHFALGNNGKSHPLTALTEPLEVILDAAGSCPMEAISVRNAETGEQLAP
jgi:ferredoxin